jgi:hypothetical protein
MLTATEPNPPLMPIVAYWSVLTAVTATPLTVVVAAAAARSAESSALFPSGVSPSRRMLCSVPVPFVDRLTRSLRSSLEESRKDEPATSRA